MGLDDIFTDIGTFARTLVSIVAAIPVLLMLTKRGRKAVVEWVSIPKHIRQIEGHVTRAYTITELMACTSDRGLWESDLEGNTTYVNAFLCRLVGRPAADFLGMNWVDVIHSEDRVAARASWLSAIKDRRSWLMDMRLVDGDGSTLNVRCVAKPVSVGGEIIRYVGIVARRQ